MQDIGKFMLSFGPMLWLLGMNFITIDRARSTGVGWRAPRDLAFLLKPCKRKIFWLSVLCATCTGAGLVTILIAG